MCTANLRLTLYAWHRLRRRDSCSSLASHNLAAADMRMARPRKDGPELSWFSLPAGRLPRPSAAFPGPQEPGDEQVGRGIDLVRFAAERPRQPAGDHTGSARARVLTVTGTAWSATARDILIRPGPAGLAVYKGEQV